jgi:AcrR family transcriptional regulator
VPPPSATRSVLLAAAAAEIIAAGYTAASMSSIAARLGMTKGALAYHFPAKRDLAVALASHLNEAVEAAHRDSLAVFPDSGLRAMLAYLFNLGERCQTIENAAGTVLAFDPVGHELDIPEAIPVLRRHFEEMLERASRSGELRAGAPEAEAGARMATIYTIGAFAFQHRYPEDQRQDLRGVKMLLAAVGAADPEAVTSDVATAQRRGLVPAPPVFTSFSRHR